MGSGNAAVPRRFSRAISGWATALTEIGGGTRSSARAARPTMLVATRATRRRRWVADRVRRKLALTVEIGGVDDVVVVAAAHAIER